MDNTQVVNEGKQEQCEKEKPTCMETLPNQSKTYHNYSDQAEASSKSAASQPSENQKLVIETGSPNKTDLSDDTVVSSKDNLMTQPFLCEVVKEPKGSTVLS